MSKTRTIHFDATRAFVFSTVAVGVLGAAFAGGFRLGQEMPIQVDVTYDANGMSGSDHVEPIVAPAQPVPAETYTFYEHTRTVPRSADRPEAEEPEAPVRVLEREPSAAAPAPTGRAAEGGAPVAAPQPAAALAAEPGEAPQPVRPERTVLVAPSPSPEADPGAIERVAIVSP